MNAPTVTIILDIQDFDQQTINQCFVGLKRHRAIVTASGKDQLELQTPENVRKLHFSDAQIKNRAQRVNLAVHEADSDYVCLLEAPAVLTDEVVDYALGTQQQAYTPTKVVIVPFVDVAVPHDNGQTQDLSDLRYSPRPRMSRGRLILVSRKQWRLVRGLDEKTKTTDDCESELIYRFAWFGLKIEFVNPRNATIFSLNPFGKPSSSARFCGPDDPKTIRQTRAIIRKDTRPIRNIDSATYPIDPNFPLISVVVATYNRADYIRESIDSVLGQTFRDFEIIVVDDGSEDETAEVVQNYSDPRVRLLKQSNRGIAAARNAAAKISNGYFTAIHDDDDIMLPGRLATSLNSIDDEHQASYGSWVNFDNESGDMVLHTTRNEFKHETVFAIGQSPGHATWLIPTKWIISLGYDETLSSAVDHNLSIRTMRYGLRWKHTGKVMFLRRIHSAQVSITDGTRQKFASYLTRFAIEAPASHGDIADVREESKSIGWPKIAEKPDLLKHFSKYLPDHLVYRSMRVSAAVATKALHLNKLTKTGYVLGEYDHSTGRNYEVGELLDIKLSDFPLLAEYRVTGVIYASLISSSPEEQEDCTEANSEWDPAYALSRALTDRASTVLRSISTTGSEPALVVLPEEANIEDETSDTRRDWTILYGAAGRVSYKILGYSDANDARVQFERLSNLMPGDVFLLSGKTTPTIFEKN